MTVAKVIVRPVRNVTLQVVTGRGPRGPAGPPGGGSGGGGGGDLTAGPGLTIVGDEIRFDIENLTRG